MTTREILKQSGLTDAQIDALDQKVISGFDVVLTTATSAEQTAVKAKEEAELAQRAQQQLYEEQIAPSLDAWATEKANLTAERDFYRTQNEAARSGGFVPKDAPGYKPPANPDPSRDGNGRFVPGPTGSPQFMTREDGFKAVTNATWLINEHIRLYGQPPADDLDVVLQEANANRMDFRQYATRKYKFEEKKAEIATAKQKEREDAIRKEERTKIEKEYAERGGNNPMVRPAAASQYANVRKAVDAGQLKDPLKMTPEERRQQTRTMIHTEMAEHASTGMVN